MTFDEFNNNIDKYYISGWRATGFNEYYYKVDTMTKYNIFKTTFIWSFSTKIKDRNIKYNCRPMHFYSIEEIKEQYNINMTLWKSHKVNTKLDELDKDFKCC